MNHLIMKKSLKRAQALLLCFVLIFTFVPMQAVYAFDEHDQTDNPDIIRTLDLSYLLKEGTEYIDLTSPYEIDDITMVESLHAVYSFALKDYIGTTGEPNRTVTEGDYYIIDLPENLIVSNPTSGDVLGNGDRTIANYSFIEEAEGDWQIKVEFTDYVDDLNEYDIFGQIIFDFTIDMSEVGEGSTTTIMIPIDNTTVIEIDVTNPVPPPTKPVSLTKTVSSYDALTRELVWDVEMLPETAIFSGCVFTDTIDINRLDLKSIKHGAVTLVEGIDYTYDALTGDIVYTIPEGRNGADYQNIVITTEVKRSVYGSLSATTISNQANLSGGENFVDIDSNTATKTITPNWFGKSGTRFEGNKIQWTLTANTTRQSMYNAVITDYFQSDVQLDKNTVKLGNTAITVYDNTHTPASDTEVYGVYTENGDGTSTLEIYLPRGMENASTAEQTITLVTSVKTPDTVVEEDPVYNNTATLDANYITDGDGEGTLPTINLEQVGVSVPYVSVVKGHSAITADDKRNGTITWIIKAASNLTDYGKTTIVDTLPDDQDYIPEEIYWGSTKIDETTEPKAEISSDGRTLTITFNGFNALQTQQTFTVKTKIKQEVYGQNLNRNFSNEVTANLYDAITDDILDSDSDQDKVRIRNTVIAKSSSMYNESTSQNGINPRVKFSITINGNLMPLSDVVITDDLSNIITEFKENGESTFNTVDGVKWTYVPDTLEISKNAGMLDSLDLDEIIANATYVDDVITVDFGDGVAVNDNYTITFVAELDVSQDDIFKKNGTIRCYGNVADIEADGLKTGVISTPATGNSSEIKNEVLEKSGVQYVDDQQIVWTINLNQHRIELDNTKVVDILPLGLTLDPTSIKLYTNVIGTDGNFVTGDAVEAQGIPVDFDYTYEAATDEGMEGRYVLTVTLPDNQSEYILRFATDVDTSLLGKQISNSAYYVGDAQVPNNASTSTMTFSSTSGGGSTSKAALTVNKVSKDTGEAVDGAVFALHWLRNGDPNDPVFVRNLTTTDGSVVFRGLTRGEIYTITEITAPDGYLLDSPNPVQVDVPTTGDTSSLTFYNTPVKTGVWNPIAIKKLDGKSIIRTFDFELSDGTTTLMTGTTNTGLPNGDYIVDFSLSSGVSAEDILTFTDDHIFEETDAAGTHHFVTTKTFYLKEIPSELPGYGFDDKVYTLVVNVYNVKGRNNLKVVIEDGEGNVLSDDNGQFTSYGIPVFQNTYRADGSIQLSAEKTVIGHSLAENQFSFELYEGSTLLQTVGNGAGMLVSDNTYMGNVYFDAINYTQDDVGTKTYRIVEKNTGLAGYTYDTAEYIVTVLIKDNDNGTLTSTIESIEKTVEDTTTTASKVEFINQYTTSDVSVALNGTKVLSGRDIEDNQFTFKLDRVTSSGDFIEEIGTVTNVGENIALPELVFEQSDIGKTYYYQLSEVNDDSAGYTYDSSVYTVEIEISDNNDGTLTATTEFTKAGQVATELEFGNTYNASGKMTITAKKTLEGKALPDEQFGFELQQFDISSGESIGDSVVVRNDENGDIVFPELSYTEADAGKNFYYRVAEIDEGIGGYTYDTTVYIVRVSVSDNGDGTLGLKKEITEPIGATEITFENSYATTDTSVSLTAQKVLNGRVLEAEQFTFVLNRVTEAGEFISEVQRVKNAEDGSVAFDAITFAQADMGKTFYYTISESEDDSAGYAYDSTVYTVKIDIVDNNDGTLTANKTILKGTETVSTMLFTNSYTTTDTTVQITAEKTLSGRTLGDGQFRYVLSLNGEGEQSDTLIEQVTNSADGEILFTAITYTQADMGKTFVYTLKEINEDKPGYEYDNTVYSIEVKVIDNGDGTLSTEVNATKPSEGNETVAVTELIFSNVYTAEGSVQFTAKKKLAGTELANKQFSYVLTDKDDNVLQTVSNDADGNIVFEEIFYNQDELGEYQYKIYELSGEEKGYTYDNTVYTINVKVTDNGDGTLSAEVNATKPGDGNETVAVTELIFSNVYTAEGSVQFATRINLLGAGLLEGQFSIVLADMDGNILQTVSNDADGNIIFDEIFFNQNQLGEYHYKMYVLPSDDEDYTYDDTVYLLTVIVTDNGDGTLNAVTSIKREDGDEVDSIEDIAFENHYSEPHIPDTSDKINILWYGFLALFSLVIHVLTKRKTRIS